MILRSITFAGGLAGAAGLSQFPEYSQQYVQRLGGAVSELSKVVEDFDNSAAAEGLSREAALAEMTGSDFVERRRADMERTFTRFDTLSADLATLREAGPFMRAYHASRVDGEIAQEAWEDFKPALPLSIEGGVFAGTGFFVGLGIVGLLLWVLRESFELVWRRKPA